LTQKKRKKPGPIVVFAQTDKPERKRKMPDELPTFSSISFSVIPLTPNSDIEGPSSSIPVSLLPPDIANRWKLEPLRPTDDARGILEPLGPSEARARLVAVVDDDDAAEAPV